MRCPRRNFGGGRSAALPHERAASVSSRSRGERYFSAHPSGCSRARAMNAARLMPLWNAASAACWNWSDRAPSSTGSAKMAATASRWSGEHVEGLLAFAGGGGLGGGGKASRSASGVQAWPGCVRMRVGVMTRPRACFLASG